MTRRLKITRQVVSTDATATARLAWAAGRAGPLEGLGQCRHNLARIAPTQAKRMGYTAPP